MRRTMIAIAATFRRTTFILEKELVRYLLKGLISLAALLACFALLENYVPSWDNFLQPLTAFAPLMFLTFFISESFFGVLPPDFFILWSLKTPHFFSFLILLALLSYIAGIVSFFTGTFIKRIPFFKKFTDSMEEKYSKYITKWGGIGIVIAAVTPLPYTPVSILAGSLRYPFSKYLLFSLTRLARFFVYGWLFWEMSV